jgi:hypothetical protein
LETEIRLANAFEAHRCDVSRGTRLSVRVIDLFGPNRFHPGTVSPTWGAMGTRRELSLRRSPARREWPDEGTGRQRVTGCDVTGLERGPGRGDIRCGIPRSRDRLGPSGQRPGGWASGQHAPPARPGRAEQVGELAGRCNAESGG